MTEALLRLQHIEFEGAGLYRRSSGELPLAKQGRVLVCGPEGSGKSIIPEVATLILYGKGAPRVDDKTFHENTVANKDTGYLGKLAFDSGFGVSARSVLIEQAFKHARAGSRYVITIDGVRDTTTGKPGQKRVVKRLAPLSYEEWLGVVYMHQGGLHDLLSGSAAEKQKYLTSVFGLDFYVDLINVAKEEMKNFEERAEVAVVFQQRRATIEEELREANKVLSDLPSKDEINTGIEKLSTRLQTTAQDLGRLEAVKTTAAKRARIQEEYNKIALANGWASKLEVQANLDNSKTELRKVGIERAAFEAQLQRHTEAQSAWERVKGKHDLAKHAYETIKADGGSIQASVEGVTPMAVLAKLTKLLEKAERHNVENITNPKGKSPVAWDEALRAYQDAESLLEKVRKLVQHTTPDHRCPTCTRPLQPTEVKKLVDDLTAQRDSAYQWSVKGLYLALKEALGDFPMPKVDSVEDFQEWARAQARLLDGRAEFQAKLDAAKMRLDLAADALKTVQEPKDPGDLASKVEELDSWIEGFETSIAAAQQVLSLSDQLDALADASVGDGVEERIAELRAKKVKLDAKYVSALDVKRERDQAEATVQGLNKQYHDVEQKLQQHAENALRLKEYETTIIPYFSALRAAKVTSCVGLLEQVLPVYVNALASDQYKGSECRLVVSDDLETIDLQLRPSRYGSWGSALQASGGQRQRFTLAIIGSLYEVSPRKANVLWYDEPFGHMQADGKMLVVNRLIPMLLDRCPTLESVFIIAHDKEILESANDSFDSVWTVDCDENGSRVSIGQRLAMVAGV